MKTKELDLAYKLRHALDQSAADLPTKTAERLASARNIALSRKKQDSAVHVVVSQAAFAGSSAGSSSPKLFAWISRAGLVIPLAALVFGLMGIYQFEQRQQIIESAAIDAEVLTDDLPLSAYLDNGFGAFLAKGDD
jgi:hypothetical protein